MERNLLTSQKPIAFIRLTCSVITTRSSTSLSVREPRGIMERSREVTETTRNGFTTSWVSILFRIFKSKWSVICAVLTGSQWLFSVGSLPIKSKKSWKTSALDRAPLLQSSLGASPLLPTAKAFNSTRYFFSCFFSLTSLTKLHPYLLQKVTIAANSLRSKCGNVKINVNNIIIPKIRR